MNKYAYPLVGATGLCNMLYPWGRAVVWARDNNAKVIAPNWVQFRRLGVWIRREKDKRTYINQFTNDGYVTGIKKWWLLKTLPQIGECDTQEDGNRIRVFSGREEHGWMEPIKHEAAYLRCELKRIVNKHILQKLEALPKDFIGVHIRRGDFKLGDEMLPARFYLTAIERVRKDFGNALPVLAFSDGTDAELSFLSTIPRLKRMPTAPAVQDLLALSMATTIIGTNHSTFSYWGAYLSCGKPSYWSTLGHKVTLPEDVCPVIYL